jgi:TatD DNase family protein
MKKRGIDIKTFFADFLKIEEGCADSFLIDIGTKSEDLHERIKLCDYAKEIAENCDFLKFSAGIWPSKKEVENRFDEIEKLKKVIEQFSLHGRKELCAIGECGFDRRENPLELGKKHLSNEEELFSMQIEIAKKNNLSLIVHSRDAFAETYGVIKNGKHDKVVIHCFSYDKKSLKLFLDLGCYISFSGAITYGNKTQKEINCELLRYMPKDMILLETDAPYLAPMPLRGTINTPLLIKHTYQFVAKSINVSDNSLAEIIKDNANKFFNIKS